MTAWPHPCAQKTHVTSTRVESEHIAHCGDSNDSLVSKASIKRLITDIETIYFMPTLRIQPFTCTSHPSRETTSAPETSILVAQTIDVWQHPTTRPRPRAVGGSATPAAAPAAAIYAFRRVAGEPGASVLCAEGTAQCAAQCTRAIFVPSRAPWGRVPDRQRAPASETTCVPFVI